MNTRYLVLAGLFLLALAGGLVWTADHYHRLYQSQKNRADAAEQRASSSEAITANVLRMTSIFNAISEANQHAKEQIALDASRTASDIKVAVAHDDCAARLVPAGATDRLREYADSLRASSGGSVTGQPDR
ncbi:peptidase [Salmonella enterica subsp. enterica serovar Choleraesuis]|nr:peptidase [Salmonella enterica subsp. enterica serovar Choleraesuis]